MSRQRLESERGRSLFVPVPRVRDVARRAHAQGIEVGPLLRPWLGPRYEAHPTPCQPDMKRTPAHVPSANFAITWCAECRKTPQGRFWHDVHEYSGDAIRVAHVLNVTVEKLRGLLLAQHPVNARAMDSAFGYYRRALEMIHEDGDQSHPAFYLKRLRSWLAEDPDVDGVTDRDKDFVRYVTDLLDTAWSSWMAFLDEVADPAHAILQHTRGLAGDTSLFPDRDTVAGTAAASLAAAGEVVAYVRVNEAARHASRYNHYPNAADLPLCLALERPLLHDRDHRRERGQYVHSYDATLPVPPAGWPGFEVVPAPVVPNEEERDMLIDQAFTIVALDPEVPFADVLAAVSAAYA